MSQDKLAESAGVNKSWLQKVELGIIRNPGTRRLRAICDILGIDFNGLYSTGVRDSKKEAALQLGTSVLSYLDQTSISISVLASNDCLRVTGTMRLPIGAETEMFRGHVIEAIQVENGDMAPYYAAGDMV